MSRKQVDCKTHWSSGASEHVLKERMHIGQEVHAPVANYGWGETGPGSPEVKQWKLHFVPSR